MALRACPSLRLRQLGACRTPILVRDCSQALSKNFLTSQTRQNPGSKSQAKCPRIPKGRPFEPRPAGTQKFCPVLAQQAGRSVRGGWGIGPGPPLAMSKFTKVQPKDGDTVLHCGHLENKPHHFFATSDPSRSKIIGMPFTRPDGTCGVAKWMVLCQSCFPKFCDTPHQAMRADSQWIGDEPAIKENVQ